MKMNKELIFWNVDTQYDFMRNDSDYKGKLPIEGAKGIEPNLKKFTDFADFKNLRVVNTADWHDKNSKELSENPDYRTTFPEHAMKYTRGALFVPAVEPKNPYVVDWSAKDIDRQEVENSRNIVIYKDAFDVFTGNKYTNEVLDMLNPDKVVVYGVATNVCVDFAVQGLLDRGKKVYVPVDAIKELPGKPLDEILNGWKQKGAILTTTDACLRNLDEMIDSDYKI
jgi:nicotinamidase/pyrazinamidase